MKGEPGRSIHLAFCLNGSQAKNDLMPGTVNLARRLIEFDIQSKWLIGLNLTTQARGLRIVVAVGKLEAGLSVPAYRDAVVPGLQTGLPPIGEEETSVRSQPSHEQVGAGAEVGVGGEDYLAVGDGVTAVFDLANHINGPLLRTLNAHAIRATAG